MPYNPNQPRDPGGEGGGQWIKAGFDTEADEEAAELKAYLKMVSDLKRQGGGGPEGYTYKGVDEFVLKNGQAFKAPLGLPKGVRKRKLGLCFMNAYQLVDVRSDLTYVEGYASFRGVPMLHAWAVDKNNRVIDPTWAGQDGYDPKNYKYFGVKFKIDDVRRTIFARKRYGVLHNPEQDFPLLK